MLFYFVVCFLDMYNFLFLNNITIYFPTIVASQLLLIYHMLLNLWGHSVYVVWYLLVGLND